MDRPPVMADPAPEHLDAATWLHELYGTAEDGWLTLFTLDRDTGRPTTDWAPVTDLDALAALAVDREPHSCVWFGVATRERRLTGGARGGASDCAALPGLWVDIDIEGPGHRAAGRLARDRPHAHRLVDAFPLPPTAVIDSGGGLQAWWLFAEMADVDDKTTRLLTAWGATWARLADEHGIDLDNVFDVPRVMRLPGTTNRKEDLARPVAATSVDFGRRYGLDDLDTYLDEPPPPPRHRSGTELPYIGPERPGDAYNLRHTGGDLLGRYGFTLGRTDRNGDEHWVRPGKEAREGTSATVYREDGHTTIWSSTVAAQWPAVQINRPYDPFGLYAALEHGGRFDDATRALRAAGFGSTEMPTNVTEVANLAPAPTTRPVEPTPIPDTIPPAVPIDAYPTWIGDQITNVARQLGCDPVLPAVFALGALSVASLGHIQVKLRAGETLRSTGLYLAAAGVPATGKSPALDFMIDPVRDHEETCIAHSENEVARAEASRSIADKKAKEAIDNAARTGDPATETEALRLKAAAAAIIVPPAGEMMTTNITPEKLAGLMQANAERMAIVSDESGVLTVDRYGDKNTGANMDVYLQGFTGQQVTVHRVTAPNIRMRHPLLAIVAGVQPEKLTEALANEEFRVRGLGSRFLTASCSKLATNTDIDLDLWDDTIGDTYAERLTALARQWSSWNSPAVLTIEPAARKRYSAWAAELRTQEADGGILEGESGWVSKLRSSTVRIAALFHLADGARHDDPITIDVLERAIRVADFFIAHHCRDTSDTTHLARRLLATMVELASHPDAVDGVVAKRTLGRNASRNLRTLKQYAAPMAVLVDCGWVELVPDTLSFAASTEEAVAAAKGFRLNPAAARHDATRATNVNAEWSTEGQSHGASNFVARVARVAKGSSETPSPPSFQETEGGPGDTRDTRDNEPEPFPAGYEPGALFDRPGVLPPETDGPTYPTSGAVAP